MTVVLPETPAWAGVFASWIHPASLICAFVFPMLRACVLKMNRLPLTTGMWVEAFASGLSLPSFVALTLSIVAPSIRTHLDGHVLALAGAIGVIYTMAGLVKVEREEFGQSRFR